MPDKTVPSPSDTSRVTRAEARTEAAEKRSEQAEARTEVAEKRTAKAIRASELNYRRLFEATKDGILTLESDSGQINDVNPYLIEMLGLSRHEIVGHPIWELGAFMDIVANKAKFEELREKGYVRADNLPLVIKDGRRITVEFITNVYQIGERNAIQCHVRDITERKRVEDKIRLLNEELEKRVSERTQELLHANEELEAFGYSISHDLRAPLRHVIGFLEILQKDAAPTLSQKSLDSFATIFHSASRMQQMIDDLLAFSRNVRAPLRKQEVNLDKIICEAVVDFRKDTENRNIVWRIIPLPSVWGDPSLLRMVLINFISNAVKFTGSRPQAIIEVGCKPSAENETIIFIKDNGAGFDPLYAARLFGVFQRLHSQDEFEGTGVGLSTVRRIITRHGGRVWAEGAVGAGATFYFSLPAKPSAS